MHEDAIIIRNHVGHARSPGGLEHRVVIRPRLEPDGLDARHGILASSSRVDLLNLLKNPQTHVRGRDKRDAQGIKRLALSVGAAVVLIVKLRDGGRCGQAQDFWSARVQGRHGQSVGLVPLEHLVAEFGAVLRSAGNKVVARRVEEMVK